jgi:preprotein translocase subunit SecF
MELLRDTNIDFMKYRKFWIIVSLVLVGIGIFAMFFHGQLNVGVDFAGGTQMTVQFRERPDIGHLRSVLSGVGLGDAEITRFGKVEENEALIRTRLVKGRTEGSRAVVEGALDKAFNGSQAAGKPDLNRVGADSVAAQLVAADPDGRKVQGEEAARAHYDDVAKKILAKRKELGLFGSWNDLAGIPGASPQAVSALQQRATLGSFTVTGVENVGPQIGAELRQRGLMAVGLSFLGMLIYIWIRFELRFGVGAIMACIHDVLVTLGLFAIFGYEFNLTTVAAFLTLIGYSVNDTVVIFDRIRENMRKNRRQPLIVTMNESINQTLSRTILTGGSTLLALACLLWLGSEAIRGFSFVMLVGILVGTYSSIYVASPFALLWEQYIGNTKKGDRTPGGPEAERGPRRPAEREAQVARR